MSESKKHKKQNKKNNKKNKGQNQQPAQQESNENKEQFSFRESMQDQDNQQEVRFAQDNSSQNMNSQIKQQSADNIAQSLKKPLSIEIEDTNTEGQDNETGQRNDQESLASMDDHQQEQPVNLEDTTKFRDNKSFKISPNQTPTRDIASKKSSNNLNSSQAKIAQIAQSKAPEINDQALQKQMKEVESLIEESKKAIADNSSGKSESSESGSEENADNKQPKHNTNKGKQEKHDQSNEDEDSSVDKHYGSEKNESGDDDSESGEDDDDEEEDDSQLDESEKERRQRAKERVRAQMPTRRKKKFEVNYTVGRIEDGTAILLSSEHNILDVPLMLLPKNIKAGNILKFKVERNLELERKREAEILSIQKQILEDPNFFANM